MLRALFADCAQRESPALAGLRPRPGGEGLGGSVPVLTSQAAPRLFSSCDILGVRLRNPGRLGGTHKLLQRLAEREIDVLGATS